MDTSKKDRVLNSPWTLIVAVATVGPLAIPLVWRNPRYSRATKMLLTVGISALTVYLLWVAYQTTDSMMQQMNEALQNY